MLCSSTYSVTKMVSETGPRKKRDRGLLVLLVRTLVVGNDSFADSLADGVDLGRVTTARDANSDYGACVSAEAFVSLVVWVLPGWVSILSMFFRFCSLRN